MVDQVATIATVGGVAEGNDPSGALPELKYARSVPPAPVEVVAAYAVPAEHFVYTEADPGSAVEAVDPNRFYEPGYTATLEQMIDHVVAQEGPILDVIVARCIARAHGWVRTGSRIRDLVEQIARACFRSHEEEQTGIFFWPSHIEEDTAVVFRRPGDDESVRGMAEICLAEIRALVDEMTQRGHEAEALIYAVAKEAGVSKLAHAGRQRIERAMRR